jgi:hypothetical protein
MDYINNTCMDQRQHMETSIMDGLPPVSEDKQLRWRLAPPDQQESTETKLADVHSHRTTAQGSQITTDSTQDGHRGKTSTLPKKENPGTAAQDCRLVWQVQWKKRSPSTTYWRSATIFTAASNDLTQGRFDNSLTLYLLCYFVYL